MRYRWRTRMRARLPWMGWAFPRGKDVCGAHEEYLAEEVPGGGAKLFLCHHCQPYERIEMVTRSERRESRILTPR